MGFYQKYVLPRMITLVMKAPAIKRCRAELIPRAKGRVLDVGIGSGLNLSFYDAAVTHVCGIDPSRELLAMVRKPSRDCLPVDLLRASAEFLPLQSSSIDTVVLTWVLCSIPNPVQALVEIQRVLKPGGALIFAEHGHSPDCRVNLWQHRLNPLWRRLAGGCNINRKIDELISAAGFQLEEMRTSYFPGPRFLTYVYQGIGRRA